MNNLAFRIYLYSMLGCIDGAKVKYFGSFLNMLLYFGYNKNNLINCRKNYIIIATEVGGTISE